MQTRDQKKAQDEYKKVLGSSKPSLASNQNPHIPNTSDHTRGSQSIAHLKDQLTQMSEKDTNIQSDLIYELAINANAMKIQSYSSENELNPKIDLRYHDEETIFDANLQVFICIDLSFNGLTEDEKSLMPNIESSLELNKYLRKKKISKLLILCLSTEENNI